ncbi:putative UPF0481 protein At3g02645 [Lycium ferocissimum]|uniref:putative UPF0481 protein At3g02645 n=1 Tax=Lycium ferocissimum TaxID=112874 RepID=UPI0028158058|nr:putative UPF0481 protein At3g02645 [Lycium ferocissimum]
MSTESSFIDNPLAEQRWLIDCINTFKLDKEIAIDFSPCICQVPKSFKETNTQAYVPQKIGLGPYHFSRPDFFVTQRYKLNIARNRMNSSEVQDFINDKLRLFEPIIRACYDKFLDIDTNTLNWTLTIDSLYLLHFLTSYPPHDQIDSQGRSLPQDQDEGIDSDSRSLAKDIIMLENQIPCTVLIELQMALNQPYDLLFEELFYSFCKSHSPLQLAENKKFRHFRLCKKHCPHLLAYMHHLIVPSRAFIEDSVAELQAERVAELQENRVVLVDTVKVLSDRVEVQAVSEVQAFREIVRIGAALGIPGASTIEKPVNLISQLPWDQITGLLNKNEENKPRVEEIEIPSVAELEEIVKVKFKLIGGGIRNIKYIKEGDKHVIYLPAITLNSYSEVILRNLVAYEAATAGPESALELAEYVDFMCGIVDTPKDVEILKKANIIKENSTLNDEEIADLFNGIPKTTGKFKKKKKSDLEKAIEAVNEKFDNKLTVKAYKFIKKHIYTSWKFLSLLYTILLILLLSLQAFCQVYGCSNRWFHYPANASLWLL